MDKELIEMRDPYNLNQVNSEPNIYHSFETKKKYKNSCYSCSKCILFNIFFTSVNILFFYLGAELQYHKECICNNTKI